MRALLRYLAQGVLIAVPIAVTLYVVYALVKAVGAAATGAAREDPI
jgi:uncharacterized membrane protein